MKLWDFIMLKLKTSFETLKAEYEAHVANDDAHNVDRFFEKDAENVLTAGETAFKCLDGSSDAAFLKFLNQLNASTVNITPQTFTVKSTTTTRLNMLTNHRLISAIIEGTDGVSEIVRITARKDTTTTRTYFRFRCMTDAGLLKNVLEIHSSYIDFKNLIFQNPYNIANNALSGTPRIIVTYIGDTPYFHKVYPTIG